MRTTPASSYGGGCGTGAGWLVARQALGSNDHISGRLVGWVFFRAAHGKCPGRRTMKVNQGSGWNEQRPERRGEPGRIHRHARASA